MDNQSSSACSICYDEILQSSAMTFEIPRSDPVSIHLECLHSWIEAELNEGKLPRAECLLYKLRSCKSIE